MLYPTGEMEECGWLSMADQICHRSTTMAENFSTSTASVIDNGGK